MLIKYEILENLIAVLEVFDQKHFDSQLEIIMINYLDLIHLQRPALAETYREASLAFQ